MNSLRKLTLAAALALPALPWALGQQVQGPTMGLVADVGGRQIRPLLGVPGAAVVGAPIDTGAPVTIEAVSPAGNYALVRGTDRSTALWTSSGGLQPLPGLPSDAYQVTLSPQGASAAFYSAGDDVLRVISGLPAEPSSISEIPLDSLESGLQSFTVSDDGLIVLCAEVPTDAGSAAVVLGRSGKLNRIAFTGPITALAFAGGSHDAAIATGTSAFVIRRVEVPGSTTVVDTGNIGAISSAALASDGRHVILASADSGRIAVTGLPSAGAAVVIDCHCVPEGLIGLNNNGAYRLSGYDGAAMRILDTHSATPRILVVPASLNPDNLQ